MPAKTFGLNPPDRMSHCGVQFGTFSVRTSVASRMGGAFASNVDADSIPRTTGVFAAQAGIRHFEVYRGGVDYPLDAAPVWRYIAKGALNEPQVAAVEQFRKAIDESEKQRQQKP